MPTEPLQSRRTFFHAGAGLALALLGCNKERDFACTQTNDLTAEEAQTRTAAGYEEPASDSSRVCNLCQQWQERSSNQCGGCKLMRGPIHPLGTCRLFVATS
jgi:hypothetical protein